MVVSASALLYMICRLALLLGFIEAVDLYYHQFDDSGTAQILIKSIFNHTVDNEDGTERRNLGHPMG